MVVAQSGIPNPGDTSFHAIPAQIKVFKESYNPSPRYTKANIQNPKLTISLESAQISIVGSLPAKEATKKLSKTTTCSFTVTTREGSCYEFVTDKESDRLVWVTVLEFLSMFPYSSVPEVPRCNPLFQRDLDPEVYSAGIYTYITFIYIYSIHHCLSVAFFECPNTNSNSKVIHTS